MIKLGDGSMIDMENILSVSKIYKNIIGYVPYESDDSDDELDECEDTPIYDNYFIVTYKNGVQVKLSDIVYNEFKFILNNPYILTKQPNILTIGNEQIDIRFVTKIGEIEVRKENYGFFFWERTETWYRFELCYKGNCIFFVNHSLDIINNWRNLLIENLNS